MELPWDLPSQYDVNDKISMLKLMGINLGIDNPEMR